MTTTKFLQDAIKQGEVRIPVWYSLNKEQNEITVFEAGYADMRGQLKGFNVINNSDTMTDYFETSRIKLKKGDKHFDEAVKAYHKKNLSGARRAEKRAAKRQEELAAVENKIKVEGKWFEIVHEEAHPRLENFTRYQLKRIGGRAKKLYMYSQSKDGKKYCPLHVIGNL